MRCRSFCSWAVLLAVGVGFFPAGREGMAGELPEATVLNAQYEIAVKECRTQLAEGKIDLCLTALRTVEGQVDASDAQDYSRLKQQIGYSIAIAEAYKEAASRKEERPDLYYRILFKAYAKVPESYFPYDEVLPLWNLYLREDTGRQKFQRYRDLRLIIRADNAHKDLEEAVFRAVQQRLLDYGFALEDPSSSVSTRPDVLVKAKVKGYIAQDIVDPRLQGKQVFRMILDIKTLKFIAGGHNRGPIYEEIERGAHLMEAAREDAVHATGDRIADLIFYHSLREMFHPMPG